MPMAMIRLRAGVNVEVTASLNEAGISTSSLIRFRAGLPEKVGGWEKYVQFSVGGVPKAMHAWLDVNEAQYLTVGSTTILANISNGTIADLTPQTFTSDFAPDFDTTDGQPTVVVDDPNISDVTTLDSIEFKTPISVGGIILSGVYPIDLVTGTTTYKITAATNATATVADGGATPVFTITGGTAEVSVGLADHGLSEGGEINFPISTPISVSGNTSATVSLIHANGADTSTTFDDSAAGGSGHVWTASGNAQIDTAQFKFGGASLLCDGTGDWIGTPDSADFVLGTSNFRIEGWFRPATAGAVIRAAGQADSGLAAATSSWYMARNASNKFEFYLSDGATFTTLTSTSDVTTGSWTHGRAVRSSNTIYLFINGVLEASSAFSGTVPDAAVEYRIGAAGENTTTPWNGWIDEVLFDVGGSPSTAAFTPPVAEYGTQDIEILGTYTATTITDADNFVIGLAQVPDADSVVAMNGGEAEIVYYIALGPSSALASGYGIGTYSSGGYGIGTSGTSQQAGTPITATDWTLDNWGDTLLACPEGGGIYLWRPGLGLQNAQVIPEAPIANTGMFISQQTQMVIAYGATADLRLLDAGGIGLDRDPLLVAWCDNGNFLAWNPAVDSQAGSRRLPTGSKVVGGLSVAQQELLWTDLGLWAMTYLGSLQAGVWGFNQIGVNCGLIGKHAYARLGANVYWMGYSNFFRLGGTAPEPIPCTVWDVVFQDINEDAQSKSWAWANTPFNEVWFFFPRASTAATDPDYYVKLNVMEGAWDHGPMPRSCGIDQSILGKPISATPTGIIYQHETSPNADGAALTPSFTTGFFQISDGLDNMFVDWFMPDFKWGDYPSTSGATVQITLYSQFYPNGSVTTYGPFTVTAASPFFNPRLRGRLVSMTVASSDLDSFWRLGGCRARMAPSGRNP